MNLFSCDGHVALVTGAGSGIGRACAVALAEAGARVVIAGLAESAPDAVVVEIARTGGEAIAVVCDVTHDAAAVEMVDAAVTTWGRLDTVVANAGAALDDPGAEDVDRRLTAMFELHVQSVVRLADQALPVMARGGGGAFLVMSSLSGLRGNRRIGGYGITKAANAQLARNIAVQWGSSAIRANALSPGVIETDFAAPITADPGVAAARLAKTPLGRFGTPEEVAAAVVWLASPGGAFVSGQNIVIDGGTLASD